MQTFNEKLQEHKQIYDTSEKCWEKQSMPEVKAYNLQYRKVSGLYPYNAQIEEYILTKEKVSTELIDHLGMEIYLSQQDIRADEKKAQDEKMIAEGWIPIPHERGEICTYRGKAMLKATQSIDWLTAGIEKEGTIVDTPDKNYSFFIPKGKRSRGYYLENLSGYYKPIK